MKDYGRLHWVCPVCSVQRSAFCEDRWGQTARIEMCRWCGPNQGALAEYWEGFACNALVEIQGAGRGRGIKVNGRPVPSSHTFGGTSL